MPLDPRLRRLLDMMGLAGPGQGGPPTATERRAQFARFMAMVSRPVAWPAGEDLRIEGPGGPLALRLYDGAGKSQAPALLFFHGGGLVAGSIATHDGICRGLAAGSGAKVFSVDYRLAPEWPYPAAIEDAKRALGWLAVEARRLGIDAARLAVGGDSAGATLAAILCDEARGAGLSPPIRAQLLLCPVLDMTGSLASRRDFADGYLIDAATLRQDLEAYGAAGMDLSDPRLSPLFVADPGGLPPAIIHTAEFDPMRDEGEVHAHRLAAAGVTVRLTRHPGMIHSFYGLNALLPQAETAIAAIAAELAIFLG